MSDKDVQSGPSAIEDKGPWRSSADGRNVFSDDFTVDVALRISGDFRDDNHRQQYAAWLTSRLNQSPPAGARDAAMDAFISDAVNRFLAWRLPEDFAPDCGISFKPITNPAWTHDLWPSGTNLFHAGQARAMFEHCLEAALTSKAEGADARTEVEWLSIVRERDALIGELATEANYSGYEVGARMLFARAASFISATPKRYPALATPPAEVAGSGMVDQQDVREQFTEWLAREMPAGTVIGDPRWWAPKIIRAFHDYRTIAREKASAAATGTGESLLDRLRFTAKDARFHGYEGNAALMEEAAYALAAQPAPVVGVRDYTLEHAEFLAKGAERVLEAINAHHVACGEDGEEHTADEVSEAEQALGDAMTGLRSDIYEFRKRRDKLLAARPGGEALPVTDGMVDVALDGFNEAAADGELLLTSHRDAARMRHAIKDAIWHAQLTGPAHPAQAGGES